MAYGPIADACHEQWGWDAHCVQYWSKVERRLASVAALPAEPEMRLWIVDVDGPNHRWTAEWWAKEREKVAALFKKRGRGYAFTSRGGYKIIYAVEPLALRVPGDMLRWKASYEDWLADLEQNFEIVGDHHCAPPWWLFRLPRTSRALAPGQPGVLQDPSQYGGELGEIEKIVRWPLPYAAADDPRCVYVPPAPRELAEAAPVADAAMIEACEEIVKAWPPRGRHDAALALTGALISGGWSEDVTANFVSSVIGMTHRAGDPEYDKWSVAARATAEKVARGEPVTGWPQLIEKLCTGADARRDDARAPDVESAVLRARRAIRMGPAEDSFVAARAAVRPTTVRELLAAAQAAGDPAVAGADERFAQLLDEAGEKIGPAFETATKKGDRKRDLKEARPMFSTLRAVFGRNVPPPSFLVDGLVPAEGVGAVSGEPKSGKSWDLLHVCVALASGRPAFGRFAVQRPAGTAYFSVEDTEASVHVRAGAIARALDLPTDGEWADRVLVQPKGRELDVCSQFDMSVFCASIWRAEEVSGVKVRLVGIDPLSDVHGKKEDSRDEMSIVMAHFRAIARILSERSGEPVVIAFVHHSGKASADNKGRKRGGQKMRGSSAIHGAVDFGIYVMDPEGDLKNEFIGKVQSETKAGPAGGMFVRKLVLEDTVVDGRKFAHTATWTTSEVTETNEPKDLAEERALVVVKKLFNHGAPLTSEELKRKMGGGKAATHTEALQIAKDNGWIQQRFHGKQSAGYEITAAGVELVRGVAGEPVPEPRADGPFAAMLGGGPKN